MIELRILRYFPAAEREKSIKGAVKLLNVTQPTSSKQLMELEEELTKNCLYAGSGKLRSQKKEYCFAIEPRAAFR